MSEGIRRVLFYRDFRGFSGGHLKVWDYFNHVRHSSRHEPHIRFSENTLWDDSNPWLSFRDQPPPAPTGEHGMFLAGLDWLMLEPGQRERSPVPIINLVQHVRHGRPDDPRYAFLRCRAVRICVSEEVRNAIADTGQVNGPTFVAPNAIDLHGFPEPRAEAARPVDILIAAFKQPELGQRLRERLQGSVQRIDLLTAQLRRPDFLDRINQARVVVFLPHREEGFFLPALEAMALETVVVCPDCVGNRGFCVPDENCFRPDYSSESIVEAARAALLLPPAERQRLLLGGRQAVLRHDLMKERQAFLEILEDVI
jgi:hypothetical protein